MQTLTLKAKKASSTESLTGNQTILMDALVAREELGVRVYRFWCTDLSTNKRYGLATTSKDTCLRISSLLEMGLIALCVEIDTAFQQNPDDSELMLKLVFPSGNLVITWELYITKAERSATVDQLYTLTPAH